MKRAAILLFAALMALTLASGCGVKEVDSTQLDALTSDNQALQTKIAELETQVAQLSAAADDAAAVRYALGVNALLTITGDAASPQSEVFFSGSASVSASAVIPEGMALDYWSVDGSALEGTDVEITVSAEGNTVIEAVLRPELKVSVVNAYLQLLNAEGKPEGDKLTEYVFEDDDDKMISVYVCAEVPSGYEIDHWLINGVPYYFNKTVSNFEVYDLNAPATYEAVLKEKAAVAMVSVSCINCTFSGGGYTNATSGSVPAGTTITVKGSVDIGSPQYWIINGEALSGMGKSFTYTVNHNTTFEYTGWN